MLMAEDEALLNLALIIFAHHERGKALLDKLNAKIPHPNDTGSSCHSSIVI